MLKTSNIILRLLLNFYIDQKLDKMMESGKHNDLKWGNRLGYIMLPFKIAMHDDSLDYVCNAKKTMDRKKHSLEAIVTRVITETVTKLFGIEVITTPIPIYPYICFGKSNNG